MTHEPNPRHLSLQRRRALDRIDSGEFEPITARGYALAVALAASVPTAIWHLYLLGMP